MKLVLGIDGGGTSTVAWLAEAVGGGEYEVLGRGQAGSGNPQTHGVAAAVESVRAAIASAFEDAQLEAQSVASACLALAGAGRSSIRLHMLRWASETRVADRVQVVHDAYPILSAAFSHDTGLALIAGTGSLAYGRDRSGREARCGGWGPLLGDEGGGHAIAVAGLRAAVRAADGRGPRTDLLSGFLEQLGCTAVSELIEAIYDPHVSSATIASLSRVVFACSDSGDDLACQIVQNGARELAQMVQQVAAKLGLGRSAFDLAVTGGLLINYPQYRAALRTALEASGLEIGELVCVPEPVAGSVVLACRQLARVNGQ